MQNCYMWNFGFSCPLFASPIISWNLICKEKVQWEWDWSTCMRIWLILGLKMKPSLCEKFMLLQGNLRLCCVFFSGLFLTTCASICCGNWHVNICDCICIEKIWKAHIYEIFCWQQQERQDQPCVFLLWLCCIFPGLGTDCFGDAYLQGCPTCLTVSGTSLSGDPNNTGSLKRRNFWFVQVSLIETVI